MVNEITKHIHEENLNEVLNRYNHTTANIGTYKSLLTTPGMIILKAINDVIDTQSQEQVKHFEKTALLASLFARHLDLSAEEKHNLVLLAKYHDIGKINISQNILNKPSRLNDEEWEIMKQHPVYSYNILKAIPGMQQVAIGALCHHERFDGTGYPAKVSGINIPVLSRIISILDTYEVLTSGRVYRKAVSKAEALEEIKRCSGTQFDPTFVDLFIEFATKQNKVKGFLQTSKDFT